MTTKSSQVDGVSVGGTVIALIMAPVVLTIVAAVTGFVWFFLNRIFTVVRPEILGVIGASIGAVAGVMTARMACDATLKSYHPRAVAVEVWLICACGLVFELFVMPLEWARVSPVVQLIVLSGYTYATFWNDPNA